MVLPLSAAWAEEEKEPRKDGIPEPSIATSLPPWLGTTFGLRPWLASYGVTYQLNQISEGWRNSQGGEKLGNTYVGRTELVIDTDLEKLIGWKGGSTHVNGYWIQGHGLLGFYIGNILAVSNIEALPTVRLFEAWFEQKLFNDTRQSASASSPPTRNSSPASTRACSSTAPSDGRASPPPTCPAAGLPIRWRRPRCG
jgi:porin